MFWFSLQLLSETFLTLRRNERDMIKMYIGLRVKCPLFLSDYNETCIFSTGFPQTFKYKISWKSGQSEPSCFMRTDMKKLTVVFRNFAYAPKNEDSFDKKKSELFLRVMLLNSVNYTKRLATLFSAMRRKLSNSLSAEGRSQRKTKIRTCRGDWPEILKYFWKHLQLKICHK